MPDQSGARRCRCGARLATDNPAPLCRPCQRVARDELTKPPVVPASFWDTAEFRDAVRAQHMGHVFRAYRLHPYHVNTYGSRVSQALLGQWIGHSQPHVNRIEKGPAPQHHDTLAHWAEIIRMPLDMLWFTPLANQRTRITEPHDADSWPSAERPPAENSDDPEFETTDAPTTTVDYNGLVALGSEPTDFLARITAKTPVPSRIGWSEVENVRATTRAVALSENLHGGGLSCEAGISQLRWSGRLLDVTASNEVRRAMFEAVGNLSSVVAYSAFDIADYQAADQCFKFALWCSDQSGSWALRANTLAEMSRKAVYLGDVDEALSLIEFAQVRSDRVSATARAMMSALRARLLALLDRHTEAQAEVDRADTHFADRSPSDDPPWLVYYDAAEHQGSTGRALTPVAHKSNKLELAAPRLEAAIRLQNVNYPRSRTFTRTRLASLIMSSGDPHEAIPIGRQALNDANSLRSTRIVNELRGLARAAERHSRIGDVADLRQEIATLALPGA